MRKLLARCQNDSNRWLADIVGTAQKLKGLTDQGLCNYVNDLRESVHSRHTDRSDLIAPALAVSKEASRRVLGLELYDVQLTAARVLIENQIAEMQTGEGKTISALPAAIFGGILGQGVHVATPNAYLADRDYHELREVYEAIGISIGLLGSGPNQTNAKRSAYVRDITYGPGYEFGFDYLRDQMILKQNSRRPIGQSSLNTLYGDQVEYPVQTRGLRFSIVDEIDNVLIDDASSPQVLSEFRPGEATDKDAVLIARKLALDLLQKIDFDENAQGSIELTDLGKQKIYRPELTIPVDQLIRPWANYVESALRAIHQYAKDVHYVVNGNDIRIVEQSTGRIFEDRSWQSGLHQAIEAKEGVSITPESIPLAQITRQRFYRLYAHLCGMTGTTANCEPELRSIYQLSIQKIPLRIPSKRIFWPTQIFENSDLKWRSIASSIAQVSATGRPVLIGTRTILESQVLAELLSGAQVDFQLLNGKQDADEAAVVSDAGKRGRITIATNLAGRGTDIKLDPKVKNAGGLHVIVSECHASYRTDRQLIGRCARQGDPGSCQTFVSADDWLFTRYAPWFADALCWLAKQSDNRYDVDSKIRKIQANIEREQYGLRSQLLRQNQNRHKIFRQVTP